MKQQPPSTQNKFALTLNEVNKHTVPRKIKKILSTRS